MTRRPQTPGVYRLPSGRWSVRLRLPDGRRPNATFDSRQDAEAAAVALRHRLALARLGLADTPSERPGPRTLAELFGAMEASQRAAGRARLTVSQTSQVSSLWCRALGADHGVPLHRDDVTRFLAWLRENSTSRGRLTQACLVGVRTAHRLADMEPPPVPHLTVPQGSRRTLPAEDFARFIGALTPGSPAATAAALVYLLAARESEILRLRVEDVDLAAGVVRLWQAKGAMRGQVGLPIHPDLRAVLEAYSPPDEGLYLGVDRVMPLRPELGRAAERAKIPTVYGLGWLRNQAATALGEAGVAPEVISRVLRHSARSRGLLGRYDQSVRAAEISRALGLLRWPHSASEPEKAPEIAPFRAVRKR